jgi:hypothetical protein
MAHAGGRPTLYTPELAKRICDAVATHSCGLNKLCAMYDWMPDQQTVKNWRRDYSEFFALYLQAKELQGVCITENLWEESEALPPIKEEIDLFNTRFRFQQFHLAKLAPKIFGDRKDKEDDTKQSEETIKNLSSAVRELADKHEKDY